MSVNFIIEGKRELIYFLLLKLARIKRFIHCQNFKSFLIDLFQNSIVLLETISLVFIWDSNHA